MPYDVAFRHQQALDPSALVTVATSLHALTSAITDCRNAGKDAESDPAVLLLARHLGTVATDGRAPTVQLRRACMDQIAEIRRSPALLVLAHKGVAYDANAKTLFHQDGRRALKRLADALRLDEGSFEIRSNKGGQAVSGEVTLHAEELYVQLGLGAFGAGREVMFRRCRGRRDYCGERNHWASIRDLLAPDRLAARIRRDIQLTEPAAESARLFA